MNCSENLKECLNQSLREISNGGRPLQKMFKWWQQHVFDFDSSICILNYAIEKDL
jgi:hypothetical protein